MEKELAEVISEETLDKISGGLNVDKATLKKILLGAGVVVATGTAVVGTGIVSHNIGKKKGSSAGEREGWMHAMDVVSSLAEDDNYIIPKGGKWNGAGFSVPEEE